MSSLLEQLREALASQYEVERELGSGGMGTVFLAHDPQLDRRVAIKILKSDFASDTASERFLREARTLARLSHPNVVPVYQAGEADGISYYVMEYVEGETLRARLKRGPMSKDEALKLANDLLSALEAAHERGIVHRDVKPSNIFLVGEKALLGDFGIAKPTEDSGEGLTASGQRIGTPGYMAPEQVGGGEVTPATDIYAAGIVIYEAFTGRRWSMLSPTGEADWSGVPSEFIKALSHALAWSPEDRWPDSSAFRRAVIRGRRPLLALRAVAVTGAALVVALGITAALVLIRSDGSSPIGLSPVHKQLTFVGEVGVSALSPNGDVIAYSTTQPDGDAKVLVRDIAGGSPLELASHEHFMSMRWSPDGSELLYYAWSDSGARVTGGAFLVPRFGGPARPMRGVANIFTWSPDGSQIGSIGIASKFILLSDKSTGNTTSIDLGGSFLWLRDLDWSPGGGLIAFLTEDSARHAIWTITVNGDQQQLVIEDTVELASPRWSPKGNAIYYLRSQGLTQELRRIAVSSGGSPQGFAASVMSGLQVGGGAGEWWSSFTLSTDGKQLLYTKETAYSNLWLLTVEGSEGGEIGKEQLTTGTSLKSGGSISPDGKRIAFSVAETDRENIFTMPLEGGPVKRVTFMEAINSDPVWSPDGRRLAFGSEQGGARTVWTVSADGGDLQQFSETRLGPRETFALAWSPVNEILYLRPGNRNFHFLDPSTGQERPLVRNDSVGRMDFPYYSPDGKTVAVHWSQYFAGVHGLWMISLVDDWQASVLDGFLIPLGWSADGSWIFAVEGGKRELLKVPAVADATPTTVGTLPFDYDLMGLSYCTAITSDGKQAVCVVTEKQSDAWLVENFDPEMR